jgi:hypothetical protein
VALAAANATAILKSCEIQYVPDGPIVAAAGMVACGCPKTR